MSYQACFHCDLLFDVREGDDTVCPQCGKPLVEHKAQEKPGHPSDTAISSGGPEAPTQVLNLASVDPFKTNESKKDKQQTRGINTGTNPIETSGKIKGRRSIHRRKGQTNSAHELPRTDELPPHDMKGIHTGTSLIEAPAPSPTVKGSALKAAQATKNDLESTRLIAQHEIVDTGPSRLQLAQSKKSTSHMKPSRSQRGGVPEQSRAQSKERRPSGQPNQETSAVSKGAPDVFPDSAPLQKLPATGPIHDRFGGDAVPDAIDAIISDRLAEAEYNRLEPAQLNESKRYPFLRWLAYLLIILTLLFLGLRGEKPPSEPSIPVAAPETATPDTIAALMAKSDLSPLLGGVTESMACDAHIVASLDTIHLSGGPIPGLGSGSISKTLLSSDPDGPWIEALTQQLEALGLKSTDTLCLALHREATAHELFVFAHSAQRAGFRRTGLILKDKSGHIDLGILPFRTRIPTLDRNARIVIRVGRLGIYTQVLEPDGGLRGSAFPPIELMNEDQLDDEKIDVRLAMLKKRHPDVRIAVVEVNRDLSLENTTRLFEAASTDGAGERFSRLQLRLR